MKRTHIYKIFTGMLLLVFAAQTMVSCSDEPDGNNYYTFTGEMVSDYLDNVWHDGHLWYVHLFRTDE